MKILVTGGAGFIGSNFVRYTIQHHPDVEVTVLDSITYAGSLSNLEGLLSRIKFVKGDILEAELVEQLVAAADQVVHFAAETHNDNSLKNPDVFISTNIQGTFNVIQACVRHSVKMHHISTDEVFGDLPLNSDEKFNLKSPYRPSSPYSASKAASDMLVRAWNRSFGLQATISNCSNNFGPFQNVEKLIPRMINLISSNKQPELYGDGSNVRDWIHVDDHNAGIWAILERGISGKTYLLGADNQRSNLEVVESLLRILGRTDLEVKFISDRPGHDVRYAIDSTESQKELGWAPKEANFEERLAETVEHYLKQQG